MNLIAKLINWFKELGTDGVASLSHGRKFLRLVLETIRSVRKHDLLVQVSALSFKTLAAIIPLLAIILAFASTAGGTSNSNWADEITSWLQQRLLPEGVKGLEPIIEQIRTIASKAKIIGGVGFLLFFVTAYSLLAGIEKAFNGIWQVKESRYFWSKANTYFVIVVLVPVLMGASIWMTTRISTVAEQVVKYAAFEEASIHQTDNTTNNTSQHLSTDEHTDSITTIPVKRSQHWFVQLTLTAASTFTTVLALTALYYYLPFTSVKLGAAFAGGLFSGVMIDLTKWLFRFYVTRQSETFEVVYGTLLAIPSFLLWLWLLWILILLGVEIAFTTQNFADITARAEAERCGLKHRLYLAIQLVIMSAREHQSGTLSSDLSDKAADLLCVPLYTMRQIEGELVETGILRRVAHEKLCSVVPGKDISHMTLGDISRALLGNPYEIPEVVS